MKELKVIDGFWTSLAQKIPWNPVKELKGNELLMKIEVLETAVESGEGIESPRSWSSSPRSQISVESGEGIESEITLSERSLTTISGIR